MKNIYTNEDNLFFEQFGIDHPTDDVSLMEWIRKNREILLSVADKDMFRVYKNDNGVQQIKIIGYIYDAGCTMEEPENNWRYLEYGGLEMSLSEYLNMNEKDYDIRQSESKQWIGDYTEEGALSVLCENAPRFILFEELDDNTPEGIYMFSSFVRENDISFCDKSVFGDEDEHVYDVVCYDGYAIATAQEKGVPEKLKITYPPLVDVLMDRERSRYILTYRGLYDLKPRDINYGDIMLALGRISDFTKNEKRA